MDNADYSPRREKRAQRFDLQLPLRYRASREKAWLEGRTENISHTGVFFRAKRLVEVGTYVELSLEISMDRGEAASRVECLGEIVRTVPPEKGKARAGLAARILEYRFAPESQSDALSDPAAEDPVLELASWHGPP